MNCFVTGAAGFLGANLVHELNARGHFVRALIRDGSDTRGLHGSDFELVRGDISDRAALTKAMRGCDWCFHTAAVYQLWARSYRTMFATNVEGTRNVIEAASAAGCARIVHTSTVGCIALPQRTPDGNYFPTDEAMPVNAAQMNSPYKRSKWQAEQIAMACARRGMPVVIVNPSAPVGPRDTRPTPTGQVIVDFLNGRMPAYVDAGLNWVHVRDVARGHILAAAEGQIDQRYILGNAQGNWTMKQLFDTLAEISGVSAPKKKISRWVAVGAACANEAYSFVTGIPPRVPLAGARMAADKMWFNPAKAIRELGLPQTPPRQALAEAVEWFLVNGYVKPR
ncbi:MAG: hypothetical protein RLZZ350_1591 [Verrucomicrobiota bacterium]